MRKLLIFTDLDATLLDHETYSWAAAEPALRQVRQQQIPLILNSSKTISEMVPLAQALQTKAPLVAENGSVIAMPGAVGEDYPDNRQIVLGRRYEDIVFTLGKLREQHGYLFQGFHDMTADEVVAQTGLDQTSAVRARKRRGTEPLLWQDDDKALQSFKTRLDKEGLFLTRGGRFHHVASNQNKGQALAWLKSYYSESWPDVQWQTVALGDSANDFPMLAAADVAVYVGPKPIPTELTSGLPKLIVSTRPGPEGWNAAVLSLMDEHIQETML